MDKKVKVKVKRNIPKKLRWLFELIRWGSLAVFVACVVVIFAESAMPGAQSGQQSGEVTDVIEDGINQGYDKENLIDIKDFDIELSPKKDFYYIDDKIDFTINYTPANTSYKNLLWETSTPDLVSIDETASQFKCLNAGTAEISVKSEKNSSLKKSFSFEIKEIPVSGISISTTAVTLNINDIYVIEPQVLPSNASNKRIIYTSSDNSVASVDQNGIVTAKNSGSAEILLTSESNPEATATLSITVNESVSYDVNMIQHGDYDIWPSQSITTKGTFGPKSSNFSLNNLNIEKVGDSNNLLTITKKSVNASSNSFDLTIKCKNDVNAVDQVISVKLTYDSNGTILEDTFLVRVHHLDSIDASSIDESKIVTSYTGKIYNNTYYSTANNKTSDSITIKIPYLSSVTGAEYKYNKNNFKWEVSSNLTLSSKNYKQGVIKPKTLEACVGTVTYTPNTNYDVSYVFNIEYTVVEDSSRISDITFDKVYTVEHENKVNDLFVGQEYLDLLTNKVVATGGKFNSSFASSGVTLSIPVESQDKIEFIYEGTKITGLKTLENEGSAEILAVSTYETSIGYPNPTARTIKFNISNKPNVSKLLQNENEVTDFASPIVIGRGNETYFDYKVYNVVTLKNGTVYENELLLPFSATVEDTNVLSYNIESKVLATINGGTSKVKFSLDIPELSSLDKTIEITVDYTPVDKNSFKLSYEIFSDDQYNHPNSDCSLVPVGSKFIIRSEVNKDATDGRIGYKSSDNEILIIDQETGFAEALKVGEVIVTIYSVDDPSIFIEKAITVTNTSAPFKITIDDLEADKIKETTDQYGRVSSYEISLSYGKSYRLKIVPIQTVTSTTFKTEYVNKNGNETKKIVTLDKGGNIASKDVGDTTIKITFGNDDCSNKYSVYLTFKVERSLAYNYSQLHTLVRKLFGHYGLFLCTAMTGMVFIWMTWKEWWKKIVATGVYSVIGFAVAGFSELIQKYTPGRGPSWKDVGIDFGGFMTTTGVCIIIFLICWLVSYLIKKHKAKKLLEEQAIIPNSDKPMSAGKFAYEQRKLEKQRSKNKNNKTKKRKK